MSFESDKEYKTWQNKRQVDRMREQLGTFDTDPLNTRRMEVHECKTCFYINSSRIGGSAMTLKNCNNCEKKEMYSSTVTNLYCLACAKDLGVCAFCSQDMD